MFKRHYLKKAKYCPAFLLHFSNLHKIYLNFYLIFPLSQDKLSQKTSLLVRCEILGLFGNTLTVAHMYCRHNSEKFQRYVKTPLSQKL